MIENDSLDNAAPIVYTKNLQNRVEDEDLLKDSTIIDPVDSQEVNILYLNLKKSF